MAVILYHEGYCGVIPQREGCNSPANVAGANFDLAQPLGMDVSSGMRTLLRLSEILRRVPLHYKRTTTHRFNCNVAPLRGSLFAKRWRGLPASLVASSCFRAEFLDNN